MRVVRVLRNDESVGIRILIEFKLSLRSSVCLFRIVSTE